MPDRRGVRARAFLLGAAFAALVPAGASAAQVNVSPLDCAGPNACRIVSLYTVVFWLAMLVLVVVGGLIVFAALRFRRRDETEPPQIHGHAGLEIGWTIGPTIILVVLFTLTFASMPFVRNGPTPDMTITVVARQFAWEFDYPDGKVKVFSPSPLIVPTGEVIRLNVISKDVLHAWWIPRLAGQTYAIPGQVNHGWFQADQPGTYFGQCNELCGLGHSDMLASVRAVAPAEFSVWYAEQKAKGGS